MEQKNGASGAKGEGNTRPHPARHWCFTYHNYPKGFMRAVLVPWCHENGVSCYCVQEELTEADGRHLQGHISFKKKIRPMSLGWDAGIHWEKMKGTKLQSIDYCRDETKRHGACWSWKVPRVLQKITGEMLRDWQRKIADQFMEPAGMFERAVWWFWDTRGGIGKSVLMKYFIDQTNALLVSGKGADIKYAVAQYVQKHGEGPDIIIYDIPRSSIGYINYTAIEEVQNGCIFSSKYESGGVRFNTPHMICFANSEPDRRQMSEDHWNVVDLEEMIKQFV